ncbi:MAG: hypothetical protein [Caudoviricetes sp.]|nr:MAG: hypothetical protein [Caudoviricetes sp.]
MSKFPKFMRGCRVSLWYDPKAKSLPYCWVMLVGGVWHPFRYQDDTDYFHMSYYRNSIRDIAVCGFSEKTLSKTLGWKKLKQFQVV